MKIVQRQDRRTNSRSVRLLAMVTTAYNVVYIIVSLL